MWLIRPFAGTTTCTCQGVSGASRRVSPVHARRNPLPAMCVEAHISYGANTVPYMARTWRMKNEEMAFWFWRAQIAIVL
jgi:hypothetical protein